MALQPSYPPIRAKFLDDKGNVTSPWIQWFSQILGPTLMDAVQAGASGDVTLTAGPDGRAVINPKAVTLGKMADLPTHTIIGNQEVSSGTPEALTAAQVTAMLNTFTSTLQGLVSPSGGGTLKFARADGGWAIPPAAGPAGGDLSGNYPNPSVAGLLSVPLPAISAGLIRYNGSTWVFDNNTYAIGTIPVVSTTLPLVDGTAAIGVSGKWADGAHVHPTDTTRAQDTLVVHLAGAETISGSKNFQGRYSFGAANYSHTILPDSGSVKGYFNNLGGDVGFYAGGYYNGAGNFMPDSTTFCGVDINGSTGAGSLYANSGLTGGTPFAPVTRFSWSSTGVGFNGTAPVAKPTINAAAVDAATTMALVNQIRTVLINYGLAQ